MKIFLTGKPRSGKSTVLARIIDILKKNGLKIGGFITPEIRVSGKRIGFKVVDVYSGEEGILAKVCTCVQDKPRVGKYCVDVEDFERVALKALDFVMKECDLIVVDELGKMELFSKRFEEKVNKLLLTDKLVICVLHRNLVGRYRKHAKVICVTPENREGLVSEVIKILKV